MSNSSPFWIGSHKRVSCKIPHGYCRRSSEEYSSACLIGLLHVLLLLFFKFIALGESLVTSPGWLQIITDNKTFSEKESN